MILGEYAFSKCSWRHRYTSAVSHCDKIVFTLFFGTCLLCLSPNSSKSRCKKETTINEYKSSDACTSPLVFPMLELMKTNKYHPPSRSVSVTYISHMCVFICPISCCSHRGYTHHLYSPRTPWWKKKKPKRSKNATSEKHNQNKMVVYTLGRQKKDANWNSNERDKT